MAFCHDYELEKILILYTQNTPVHMRLWNHDLWRLAISNMLLTMTVYMQVVALPQWLNQLFGSRFQVGMVMGIYGLGLFTMGGFCNYLVQYCRRNHVYLASVLAMVVSLLVLYYLIHYGISVSGDGSFYILLAQRFIYGAAFGLAEMVMLSSLVIDVSESFQRTEANYGVSWFGRIAIALGAIVACIVQKWFGIGEIVLCTCLCCALAVLLTERVNFPFKAPEDNVARFSFDRFLLPDGWLLFFNLLLITIPVGLILSHSHHISFYATMTAGFFLSLIAEKYVFAEADLKSESVVGLILMGCTLLILEYNPGFAGYIPPLFLGFSVGIIGSRFLLFSIKLSHHCQRGTSQSSFFLVWEFGISIGLFGGFCFDSHFANIAGLIFIGISLLMYNSITHPWYLKHKKR